jgi:uncharacterized Zn-finger protein
MNNFEIYYTSNTSVSCEGSESPYDHPLVFLEIREDSNEVICPYCSKKFIWSAKDIV